MQSEKLAHLFPFTFCNKEFVSGELHCVPPWKRFMLWFPVLWLLLLRTTLQILVSVVCLMNLFLIQNCDIVKYGINYSFFSNIILKLHTFDNFQRGTRSSVCLFLLAFERLWHPVRVRFLANIYYPCLLCFWLDLISNS